MTAAPLDATLVDPPGAGLVSVIIPVYNTAAFLSDCVDSVLTQTLGQLEVVLVDDGSTDSSGTMCDAYARAESRVLVVHQENGGLSAARNTGLLHASGDWVMFLDSDDWLHPRCLAALHGLLTMCGAQVGLCGTARANSYTPPQSIVTGNHACLSGDEFLRGPERFEPVHPVSACGKLIERSIMDGVAFPRGRLHEDVFVTHQILHRAERLSLTTDVLHFYRQRPGSITAGTMSLRSATDKARAHLERASDLVDFGLVDRAALEFRRGLSWHLRVTRLVARGSGGTMGGMGTELAEQRALIGRTHTGLTLDAKTRLALVALSISPRMAAGLYTRALDRSSERRGVHPIEGEA